MSYSKPPETGKVNKMFNFSALTLSLMLLLVLGNNVYGQSPIQVGEEVTFIRESPHPYNESQEAAVVWRDTIVYVDSACAYIAVHFSAFGLDELDTIVVRNLDNTVSYQYSYEWLSSLDSFWSPPISGNTIILEIHVENSQGDFGYTIDKLARGFTEIEMAARLGESCPYCCGDDNKLNAICFQSLDPFAYHHSKGSGRVWGNPMEIIGTGFFGAEKDIL